MKALVPNNYRLLVLLGAVLFNTEAHAALPPLVLGDFTVSLPTAERGQTIHATTSITSPANIGAGSVTLTIYDPKNIQKNFVISFTGLTAGKPFPVSIDFTPAATDLIGGYSLSASAWAAPGYYGWEYKWDIMNVTASTKITHFPVPISSDYHLVFDDEFNGQAVDASKWNLLTNSSMGGNWSKDQFLPSNATTANGFLSLAVNHVTSSSRPYTGAFMLTKQSFTYGYWEARAKMPAGHGMWPAFWMNSNGAYPEIDIFEWLGNAPTLQWTTYHPVNDAALTSGAGLGNIFSGSDYSTAFHVYGMLWQPASITWYIDGVAVFQLTQGEIYKGAKVDVTKIAMQTILNSSVGGWNNNVADGTTVFPAKFLVDYVHIYSNDPKQPAITPQAGYNGVSDAIGSGN